MKKPGIPDTQALPQDVARVVDPMRENLEIILGRRGTKLPQLGPTAALADVINAYEAMRKLMQDESV